jgi:hypothetical protein
MAPSSSRKPASPQRQQNETTLHLSESNNTTTCQVSVCVRVRPITAKEQESGASNALEVTNSNGIQLSGRRFTFDSVFDAATSQIDLYRHVAPSLMQSFLDGYNATVRTNIEVHKCICSESSNHELAYFVDNCLWANWFWKDIYDGK